MNTNDIPATWKLGNTNRVVRAVIGVGTILSALMIPGLSEGWLFALAMIGFYDLPLDYLSTFTDNIKSVTADQIRDAFRRRVDVDDMVTVIVGRKQPANTGS